ncbi:MAG: hypothetical protein RL653_3283 [Pseudomonadota bacterium]|jgi:hypothetical protein
MRGEAQPARAWDRASVTALWAWQRIPATAGVFCTGAPALEGLGVHHGSGVPMTEADCALTPPRLEACTR